jgi:hypothetical protein
MFSKRNIVNFQPVIRGQINILCQKLSQYKESGRVLSLDNAWSALMADIITPYAFGQSYHHLEIPDFSASFHEAYMAMTEFSHIAEHFGLLIAVSSALLEVRLLRL